jgi:hypothetical protein
MYTEETTIWFGLILNVSGFNYKNNIESLVNRMSKSNSIE